MSAEWVSPQVSPPGRTRLGFTRTVVAPGRVPVRAGPGKEALRVSSLTSAGRHDHDRRRRRGDRRRRPGDKDGVPLVVQTTPANVNDDRQLPALLDARPAVQG